ncbi:trans-sulfuration enzyme family protein [Candidatus Palauibacter sp.]|uniref:trans-sulfuration enzyme family protein n=1 Tax=Candidatus Palauibacter sp. TaxID=3101350 RepID=UPI003C704306
MKKTGRTASTDAVHAGQQEPRPEGAIVTPIYQTANYVLQGEDYHDIGYIRLSTTPNHRVLGARIAALERTETALVLASGMAAISGSLLTVLSAGDHALVQDTLYGGTASFLQQDLPRFGVTHTVIDPQDPSTWAAQLRPTTRAMYVETITNPLVQVADLEAVVAFAREHGLVTLIDNTFASPVNFRPAEIGFDLVLESCTKYMNGHSDIVAGSVAGSADLVRRVKVMHDHLGGALDPHAAFLLERGLKTLSVRVREQNASAGRLAALLEAHPAVSVVHYPGLESHAQHGRAARLFDGFGGMMSFELAGGVDAAQAFMAALTIPVAAASLGGPESLVIRPAAVTHAGLPAEERARSGVTDGLVRLSVGLEGVEDLAADLTAALAGLSA